MSIRVSELNNYLRKYISMDYLLNDLEVEGEISNLKLHENGNAYFSLKDDRSRIKSIIYSKDLSEIKLSLKDGLNVLAKGSVTVYTKSGDINFCINSVEEIGEGDLYREFERLKKKLDDEGLFESAHKKNIIRLPKSIGIITSSSGAAIRDMVNLIKKRNNLPDIFIYPSHVQGKSASQEIIRAIEHFNTLDIDTLIIGRGGGSFEDLNAFNDEALARTIYKSKIPIISAVGHEIDFCISDFVSDLRASTPTDAANKVVVSKDELYLQLDYLHKKLDKIVFDIIGEANINLKIKSKTLYKIIGDGKMNSQKLKIENKRDILTYRIRDDLKNNIATLNDYRYVLSVKVFENYKTAKRALEFKRLKRIILNSLKSEKLALDCLFENLNQNLYLSMYNKKMNLFKKSFFIKPKLINYQLSSKRYELNALKRSIGHNNPKKYLDLYSAELKNLSFGEIEILMPKESLNSSFKRLNYAQLNRIVKSAENLKYTALILKNNFSKINRVKITGVGNKEIISVKDLEINQNLNLKFKDGSSVVRVLDIERSVYGK